MTLDQLFLRLYSYQLVVLLLCAALFFKAAEMEDDASPILWAGLSVAIYLATWMLLGWGILGNLAGQAGLLAAITVWKMRK